MLRLANGEVGITEALPVFLFPGLQEGFEMLHNGGGQEASLNRTQGKVQLLS